MSDWAGRLLEFVALLRRNGLAVSAAESMDALQAAALVGPGDPGALRVALRSTLVKEPESFPLFDELYALYFRAAAVGASPDPVPSDADAGFAVGTPTDPGLAEALADAPEFAVWVEVLNADGIALAARIDEAADATGIGQAEHAWQEGLAAWRIREQLFGRGQGRGGGIRQQTEALRRAGRPAQAEAIETRLAAVEAQIQAHVARRIRQQNVDALGRFRRERLRNRAFRAATASEMAAMRAEVARLGRRLRTRLGRRRRRARRGALHPQATMRANARHGFVPLHLLHRRRVVQRPELVLWLDLSESVRAVSGFALMLARAMQDELGRVRSFGFAAECRELTDTLRDPDFERALERILRGEVLQIWMRSDYGQAVREFERRYASAIGPRSTLVVIGDARSNFQPPEAERLRHLARRARRAIWLNPEPPGSWGMGDSVMPLYAPAFEAVAPVANLVQLEAAISRWVLRLPSLG